jgi:hypothetical protein
MTTETKTRAPRKAMSEFGLGLRGCVGAVNQNKLAIIVGGKIGEPDSAKVDGSIGNFVRKAGQNSGVVSKRSEDLANAVFAAIVQLDPLLEPKVASLKTQIQYQAISASGREPGQNWIVRLKTGESIPLKDGPEGDGYYKLVKTAEYDAAAAVEVEEAE